MTPDQVRELAEYLPHDWEGLGPALTVAAAPNSVDAPANGRLQVRAYNPHSGPARTVEYPLKLKSATPAGRLLIIQLNWTRALENYDMVWVVDFSQENSDPFDLKLLSSVLFGRLAPLISSQFIAQSTIEIGPGVRAVMEPAPNCSSPKSLNTTAPRI